MSERHDYFFPSQPAESVSIDINAEPQQCKMHVFPKIEKHIYTTEERQERLNRQIAILERILRGDDRFSSAEFDTAVRYALRHNVVIMKSPEDSNKYAICTDFVDIET